MFNAAKGNSDVSKQKVLICTKLSRESVTFRTSPYIAQICRRLFRPELLFVHYVYQERSVYDMFILTHAYTLQAGMWVEFVSAQEIVVNVC
jgi:hypothetical protein